MTETFISAIYVFFLVAFLASSGTEAIASLFGWRANMLFHGINTLLNEKVTGLATAIYQNPLVHPRALGDDPAELRKALPSYIEPPYFALALSSALGLEQPRLDMVRGKSFAEIEQWIIDEIPSLRNDVRLRQLLAITIQRRSDLEGIRDVIAQWFVQASDRITGAYKRRTQLSNFLIGFAIAIIFNVSPLPSTVAALTQAAATPTAVIDQKPSLAPEHTPGRGFGTGAAVQSAGVRPDRAGARTIWATYVRDSGVLQFFGWLITALSTLLGAPFWFGLLSNVTNLRGSGHPPAEHQGAPGAAPQPPVPATK